MVWINLLILSFSLWAKDLPKFLTKHSTDSIRFISYDGQFAYLQKKPGVLGLVSSFKSSDFISETSASDFLVKDSRAKQRLIIEIIPFAHQEMNFIKNHKIMVVDWGKTQTKEIGFGKNARLHLNDEWISYYDASERTIFLQNVLTQKKFQIKLSPRLSPFYSPEVEMVSQDTVVYTDINEKGFVGVVQFNLITQKSLILYKASQTGTRIELCQQKDYLAFGEFPYDDLNRSSKILQIKLSASTNLAGFTTLYSSTDSDLGHMVCLEKHIYFIKTLTHLKKLNYKQTEAVKLDFKTTQIETISDLGSVNQIIAMDGRVLIPYRGEFFVVEGGANLTDDRLKAPTNKEEELPLEL